VVRSVHSEQHGGERVRQERVCQTFTPSTTHYLNYVSLYLYKIENPTYQVTIASTTLMRITTSGVRAVHHDL